MTKKLGPWIVTVFLIAGPGYAGLQKDGTFQKVYAKDGIAMDLQGIGTKKMVFMDIFMAGFYLQKNVGQVRMLEDVGKRMEVIYFQPVGAQRFVKFIRSRMMKNMTKEDYRRVASRIESLADFFVDIKPGDLFSMTYIPQVGTTFELNGEVIGAVEGADFGKGIFSTWLGDHPFDHSVKRQVLGLDPRK